MARATMAGDDVTAIVTDKFVGERISAFTLDYRKKKIYFIDYDTVRVSRIFGSEFLVQNIQGSNLTESILFYLNDLDTLLQLQFIRLVIIINLTKNQKLFVQGWFQLVSHWLSNQRAI